MSIGRAFTAYLPNLWDVLFFVLGFALWPIWNRSWVKRWLARRRAKYINHLLSDQMEDGTYCPFASSFSIKDMRVIFPCAIPEAAIRSEDIVADYTDQTKQLPADIEMLGTTYLPALQKKCANEGKTFDNNPRYSLENFTIIRPTEGKRGRRLGLMLHFTPTDYFTFAMSNLALDELLLESGGERISIRTKYLLTAKDLDLSDLQEVPLHLPFGTSTVVVTKDNMIVLGRRSARQAVAPGDGYGVAPIGEGMLRGVDAAPYGDGERPDPFATVSRALKDELNLDPSKDYNPADIRLLALFFDYSRCQPMGVFTVRLLITAQDLEQTWPMAKDAHEHLGMYYLPNEPEDVRAILDGKGKFNGRQLKPSSRHVDISLFLSLFYYHPLASIRRAFG